MIEKRKRRRRDGKLYTVWRVRYYDATGRERSRTLYTEDDAKAFDAKVTLAKRTGDLGQLDAGKETFADFAERWWATYAGSNLARSTLATYANHWNAHALPRLGHYRLRELTPELLTAFRAELEREGVGAPAVRRTLVVLQSMLQRAVEWELIQRNPVKLVKKPRAPRRRAIVPLAPAKVEELRAMLDQRDAVLVSVLAYAGPGPMEALTLTWGQVRDGTLLFEIRPKTGYPPRTVDLLGPLKQDLAEWRLACRRPGPDQLVFPKTSEPKGPNEPWLDHDLRNWRRRVFQEAAVEVGLGEFYEVRSRRRRRYRGIVPYDLRHTYASLRLWEGASVVEVAAELGHSPAMTLGTYAHVLAELRGKDNRSAEHEIRAAREQLREAV